MTDYNVVTRLFLDSSGFLKGITESQIAQENLASTITATTALADKAYSGVGLASTASAEKQIANAAEIEKANVSVAESAKGMGVTGVMAALGITIALDRMVKSAMETDSQFASMKTALDNLGMGKADSEFVNLANNNTALGFTVNDTARSLQQLATLTHSATDGIRLNALAMDEARTKHVSLATADSMVQMQLRGAAKGFSQFGVTLDSTLPRAQAITKAMNDVQKAVKGQGEDYLKTAAGKLDALKASFGQVADIIGRDVLPVVTTLLGLIERFLPDIAIILGFATAVYTVVEAYKAWEAMQKLIAADNPFTLYVIAIGAVITILALLWNNFKWVRDIIVDIADVGLHVFGDLVKIIGWAAEQIVKLWTAPIRAILKISALLHLPGAKSALDAVNTGITDIGKAADTAGNKINSFQASIDKLRNAKIVNPFTTHSSNINDTSAITAKALIPAPKSSAAAKALAKYQSDVKSLDAQITTALKSITDNRQKGSDAISAIITSAIGDPSELQKAFDATNATASTVLSEFDKLHSAILDRMDGYAQQDKQKILDNLALQSSIMVGLVAQRDDLTAEMKEATDLQTGAIATLNKSLLDYGVAAGILQQTTNDTVIHVIQTTTGAIVTQGQDSLNAVDNITQGLTDRLTKMQDFTSNLKALQNRGLNTDYIKQLANAGIDSSGTTVDALATASDAQIAVINDTYSQITNLADDFSNTTGANLYMSGVTNLRDYISGLSSQQEAVTNQMNTITDTVTAQMAALVPMTANVGKDTATSLLENLAKYINDPKNQKAVLDNATALANQIKSILSSAMSTTPPSTTSLQPNATSIINGMGGPKDNSNYAGGATVQVNVGDGAFVIDKNGNVITDPQKITATVNMGRLSTSRLIDL